MMLSPPEPILLPLGDQAELLLMLNDRVLRPIEGLRALRGLVPHGDGLWIGAAQAADELWGLLEVDLSGCRWRAAPQWSTAFNPTEGLMRVREDTLLGCCDLEGRMVIEPRFAGMRNFSGGRAAVRINDNEWYWIDRQGHRVGDAAFAALYSLDAEGFARATAHSGDGGRTGFVDGEGRWVISPRFHSVLPFGPDGVAPASEDAERWGLIDRAGAWVLAPTHRSIAAFNDSGLARFCPPGTVWDIHYGYIDGRGRVAVAPESDISEHMACGIAAAAHDGSRYVRADGSLLPAPALSFGSPFRAEGAYALVRTEQEPAHWGMLHSDGAFVPAPGELLEPLTDWQTLIPDPPPGGVCTPFLTHDGGVAWLHPQQGVLWRARYENNAVTLFGADGQALWQRPSPCSAPHPFFSAPAEEGLKGLRSPGEIVALAEALLDEVRGRLHRYCQGEVLELDDDRDEENEDADDEDAQRLRTHAHRRVFRLYLNDELMGPYAFLEQRYTEQASRMKEELDAHLSARFGAPDPDQTEVVLTFTYPFLHPPAWHIQETDTPCWLALYARNESDDSGAWWELWLHARPPSEALEAADS